MKFNRYNYFLILIIIWQSTAYGQVDSFLQKPPRTVMVHLFEWKWDDIAKECKEYLGPAGFAAVQVSPPTEYAKVWKAPWYQRYQPVSYKIETRSGNREQFIHMVKECKKVGVDIYVDAVINHMAGRTLLNETKFGYSGTPYSYYKFLDYSWNDFHHCGRNGDDRIHNYQDRVEVQTCELANLVDLNTESEYVQKRIREYLEDLIQIGVAGFRIDAAKHIPTDSLNKIIGPLKNKAYFYQEVIDLGGGDVIKANEYLQNGDVTEFKYGLFLSMAVLNLEDQYDRPNKFSLSMIYENPHFVSSRGFLPSDKAIVFIDNHDNQRGHGGAGHIINYKAGQLYKLAQVFMLAYPYGYPQMMSSYIFSDPNQGPPTVPEAKGTHPINEVHKTLPVTCLNEKEYRQASSGWVCEHRWKHVEAMVRFKNKTQKDFSISHWWSNHNNQIAFARGKTGFVIINNENTKLVQKLKTGLPQGKYCNILENECVKSYSVDKNGEVEVSISPRTAVALLDEEQSANHEK